MNRHPTTRLDELIDKEGYNEVCADCEYYQEFVDHHPYGDTYASETLGECGCDDDDLCPRLQETV